MELRARYKETDVGMIPEDWTPTMLSSITTAIGDGLHSTPNYSAQGEYYFINGNNLRDGRIVVDADTKTVDAQEYKKHLITLSNLSILMSINGTIGNLALFDKEGVILGKSAAYINVRPEIERRFLYHALQMDYVKDQFFDGMTGSTIGNLGLATIRNTLIAMPPTAAERNVIADALSDADALIASLDALIAKKLDLKQATMQQLLTGKTRLPGFKGEWKMKRIGDISVVDPENLSATTTPNYLFKYISLEDVDHGSLSGFSEIQFRSAPSRARRKIAAGDILVATVRPNLKSHLLFSQKSPDWVCSTGFAVVRCIPERGDSNYLFQHIFGQVISAQIEKLITGSNYPAISSNDVRSLQIPTPSVNEQSAITAVLSDMDAELAALEAKRDKVRAIKQGMMQELLTGRIRLV